jgi:hypothetical protein
MELSNSRPAHLAAPINSFCFVLDAIESHLRARSGNTWVERDY